MTSSPTFSPAAETTTPPQTSGPAAPRPSPPGPTSPALPWLHNTRIAGHRSAHLALRQSAHAKLTVPFCAHLPAVGPNAVARLPQGIRPSTAVRPLAGPGAV